MKKLNFTDKLKLAAEEHKSIVCMGMDPVLERIPLKGKKEEIITNYFIDILEAIKSSDVRPGVVKPNFAFYAQFGFPGLRALRKIIKAYQKEGFLVILDAKRGDILKTSSAYAKEIFDFWKVDATTVSPYMGYDSVKPFIDYYRKGKGVYILTRTSNKGAADIQDLKVDERPVFMKTAEKVIEWHRPGTGAVVGATYPEELRIISDYFVGKERNVPLLIPGIGSQGGSAEEVVEVLKGSDLSIHRINSSSGISYAYQKEASTDYAGSAVKAIQKLNKSIGFK